MVILKTIATILFTSFNDYIPDDMKHIPTLKTCKRVDLGKRVLGKPL